jgi:spermidine/putrescine transport system permease protein
VTGTASSESVAEAMEPQRSAAAAAEASDEGRRGGVVPYLLSLPGMVWLGVFFFVPLVTLAITSLSVNTGSVYVPTLQMQWEWSNFTDSFDRYGTEFLRSFKYAAAATVASLVLGYPLAYVIAFRAGRLKHLLLGLVILPFFVTFLLRTLAWKTIVADDGTIVGMLETLGLLPSEDRLLSTSWAVIGGLTYNFLPFMVLPIYVALEKIDPRLIDASRDLYTNTWGAFRRVVFPLSLPGVFAGSLLVFIPAAGDFVNSYYLGSTKTTMIGNVVQNQFLVQVDYPVAAALSFVFMAIVLAIVTIYARSLGTEDLI